MSLGASKRSASEPPVGRCLLPAGAPRESLALAFGRESEWTWGRLFDEAERAEAELGSLAGARVGLSMRPTGPCFAALEALGRLDAKIFLIDGRLDRSAKASVAERFGLRCIVEAPADRLELTAHAADGAKPGTEECGFVTILTSGTTGEPKAARHTWESLRRPVRTGAEPRVWMLSYRPSLYAGLQVIFQAFGEGGCLVAPPDGADVDEIIDAMVRYGVQCASATPSYWRRLTLFGDRQRFATAFLRQITLGGEVVDQGILDALRAVHPSARIVHIYATTELGRCFSVGDAMEGFPDRFLADVSPEGVEMRIVEGELQVRSPNAMSAYEGASGSGFEPGKWFATGDLVERQGDRCVFVGRRSDLINVGGNKVSPLHVERIVRDVPGVRDARVFGRTSGIAGQLVACEIVVEPDQDGEDVVERVQRRCLESLSSHERPRLVRAVERIEVTASGKTARGVSA